jgi:hypothetical protein
VRISEEKMKEGFVSAGKMTIRKIGMHKLFVYKGEVFEKHFVNFDIQG